MAKDRRTEQGAKNKDRENGLAPPPRRAAHGRPAMVLDEQEKKPKHLAVDVAINVPVGAKKYGPQICTEDNHHKLHIAVKLEIEESRMVYRVMEALQNQVARLKGDRLVASPPDVIRWMFEQMVEQAKLHD